MAIPLTYKREQLIAALEAKRPFAEKADDAALKAHQKDEQAYLKRWREALREALKWPYEKASELDFAITIYANDGEKRRRSWNNEPDRPTCPPSRVNALERVIAVIQQSEQARFRIQRTGQYSEVYEALTADLPEKEGLC